MQKVRFFIRADRKIIPDDIFIWSKGQSVYLRLKLAINDYLTSDDSVI